MKKYFIIQSFFLLIILITLSGCSGNKSKNKSDKKNNAKVTQHLTKKLDSVLLQNIIKERNGKILLVNLWSTWSQKSMKQLSELQDLYNNNLNKSVDFVLINIDPSAEQKTKVIPFLEKNNFTIPIYTIEVNQGKTIMKMLNPNWTGNIPVIYIYNEHGIQKEILQGVQVKDNIIAAVKTAMK